MEEVPLEAMAERDLWDELPEQSGSEKADILMELHRRHAVRGDFIQAAGLAEQAAEECVSVDNLARAALCKFAQGRALAAGESLELALEAYLASAELDGKTGDQSEIAADLRAAGDICARLGDFAGAVAHFRNAESLYEAENALDEAGRVALQLARLVAEQGEPVNAVAEAERARELLRRAHDIEQVCVVDDFKAGLLLELDRVDEAVDLLRDCLRIAESTKTDRDDAYARHRLAFALWEQGDAAEALHHLERARGLYVENESPVSVALCDRLAADCLRSLGEADRAEELYRSARAVFDASGFEQDALICDVELSILTHAEARYAEAAGLNSRIFEHATEAEAHGMAYAAVSRWADNLLAAGDAAACIGLLDKHASDSDKDVAVGSTLWRLSIRAQAHHELGQREEALAAAEAAIALMPDDIAAYGKAACYEVRGLNALGVDQRQAERDLGHAIALYLGAGQDEKARALSRHFMPERPASSVQLQPSDGVGSAIYPPQPPALDVPDIYGS